MKRQGRRLQDLRNVGKATLKDFAVLGIESVDALEFVRKYKFGQLVILSIQDFVQTLRGGGASGAPLDEAALEARVLRSGVPLVACFHWILQLQRQKEENEVQTLGRILP